MIYTLVKFLSRAPMPVLYLLSDVLFLLMYRVVGYRKKVVFSNLTRCFPEKSAKEIARIAADFYEIFCDFTVEMLKGLTISKEEIKKHVQIEGTEHFTNYLDQGQTVIIISGHQFNWEWLNLAMGATLPGYTFKGIYMPLKNPTAEKLIVELRTRFGSKLMTKRESAILIAKGSKEPIAYGILGDQTPSKTGAQYAYWTQFMGQDTAFFRGMAWLGTKMNYPIVMVQIERVRRGQYKAVFSPLRDLPYVNAEEEVKIIDDYAKTLEASLRKNPANWLWTHKRWKAVRREAV